MLKHLSNSLYVFFALVFGIDEDVIEIDYYENIEFLCQDLVNIILERGWSVSLSKKYDLVIEVAIAGPEDCFLFITLFNFHPMVDIGQIERDKMLSPV